MLKIFLAVLFLIPAFSSGASAALFTKGQIDQISCAATKMQLFYFYLSKDRGDNVKKYTTNCGNSKVIITMPAWIDDKQPEMEARKVWRDPEEGAISEAVVWQGPISMLYEYFDLTKKTFPPDAGGASISPGLLVKEYADVRVRFQLALDRLYRARTKDFVMGDSLQGRGRTILASFNLILNEMESVSDAISSQDSKRYAEAVTASAVFAQDAFSMLLKPPRVYQPLPRETPLQKFLFTFGTIFGMILIFIAVQIFLRRKDIIPKEKVEKYNALVAKYTEAFSRQFIKVDVRVIMWAPAALGALLGLLLMNFFAFIIFAGAGFYLGLSMPERVLRMLKQIRGKKIDSQLMDALVMLSNCLRSGLDIVQGFEMVSKDLIPPISEEFGLVIKNYQLGMSFEKSLGVMEERVESKMLSYMIRAIVLQRQIGGNLTKVFERIVVDIREESKLDEKTKAMTAQQKIQSIVVGIMPWIMVGVMFIFQPDTMIKFYSSPIGMFVGLFCIVWVIIGMKIVSTLGKINV